MPVVLAALVVFTAAFQVRQTRHPQARPVGGVFGAPASTSRLPSGSQGQRERGARP